MVEIKRPIDRAIVGVGAALGLGGKPPPDNRQRDCEAAGGVWDDVLKVCNKPKEIKKEELPTIPKATGIETIAEQDTGEITGLTLPSGETFLGLPREDIANITQKRLEATQQPAGTAPLGTARTLFQEAQRKISLAKSVGTIDFELASQLEEQGLNVREIVFAGLQGIDLKQAAIAAGAAGALVGTATLPIAGVTAPAAAAIAGGSTLVLDFFNDVRKNIKDQRQDLVKVKTKELRQRKTAMNNYIQAANMNPAQAEDYVLAFNVEISLIRRDYNTLVFKGNEDLEFWGTDATPQIVEYNVFFESVQPSLELRMEQAVLKPEPSRAFLTIDEELIS